MIRWYWLAGALVLPACGGSGEDGGDKELPTTPPETVTKVTEGGFDSPMDAVSSPDGSTFYFSAHLSMDDSAVESTAAIFKVAASGGEAEVVYTGLPLEDPSGLLISCDGATLYIADGGHQAGDEDAELNEGEDLSPIYQLDLAGATLSALSSAGISEAASLAMSPDCETIYATGFTEASIPALFTIARSGGAAAIVKQGAPLESPSGIHVDADRTAWVMDQLPGNLLGGALFAITPDGTTTEVAGGLSISEPAGVSLTAGGGTAVIATQSEDGDGQLLAVDIASGNQTVIETSMIAPSGLKTAREAGVMAVADGDGDAIYRAE